MIIDLILDRKDNDALIEQGYTHGRYPNGELVPLAYDANKFYRDVMRYGSIGEDITMAMDYGTEQDVKNALCEYIVNGEYNPAICDYVNSREWL